MIELERRSVPNRFPISVDVKFLLRGKKEGAGTLLDISETGLALLTNVESCEGDPIVVYPVGLGRLHGKVVRKFEGGVGVAYTLSTTQQLAIRDRIAAVLEGSTYLKLTERRTTLRIKYNLETVVQIADEETPIPCTIVNMSKTGCLIRCEARPPRGTKVSVGALHGTVARHGDNGFAVRFVREPKRSLQDAAAERAA